MSDSDDDEDVRRAIALSLQESTPPKTTHKEVIDLSDDDEVKMVGAARVRRDIRRPENRTDLTATWAARHKENMADLAVLGTSLAPKSRSVSGASHSTGDGPMNPEELRARRLNRLMATSISPPPLGRKRKRDSVEESDIIDITPDDEPVASLAPSSAARPSGNGSSSSATVTISNARGRTAASAFNFAYSSTGGTRPGIQYPQGVVKKTWAFQHNRTGEEVKLEEVLQKVSLL